MNPCKAVAESSPLRTLSLTDVEQLVDNFPGQSIDFFGALRSRVYDDMVGAHIKQAECTRATQSVCLWHECRRIWPPSLALYR